jgi:hypothetical protein
VIAEMITFKARMIREEFEIRKCKENINRDGDLKISHTWDHILNTKRNKMAAPSFPE